MIPANTVPPRATTDLPALDFDMDFSFARNLVYPPFDPSLLLSGLPFDSFVTSGSHLSYPYPQLEQSDPLPQGSLDLSLLND